MQLAEPERRLSTMKGRISKSLSRLIIALRGAGVVKNSQVVLCRFRPGARIGDGVKLVSPTTPTAGATVYVFQRTIGLVLILASCPRARATDARARLVFVEPHIEGRHSVATGVIHKPAQGHAFLLTHLTILSAGTHVAEGPAGQYFDEQQLRHATTVSRFGLDVSAPLPEAAVSSAAVFAQAAPKVGEALQLLHWGYDVEPQVDSRTVVRSGMAHIVLQGVVEHDAVAVDAAGLVHGFVYAGAQQLIRLSPATLEVAQLASEGDYRSGLPGFEFGSISLKDAHPLGVRRGMLQVKSVRLGAPESGLLEKGDVLAWVGKPDNPASYPEIWAGYGHLANGVIPVLDLGLVRNGQALTVQLRQALEPEELRALMRKQQHQTLHKAGIEGARDVELAPGELALTVGGVSASLNDPIIELTKVRRHSAAAALSLKDNDQLVALLWHSEPAVLQLNTSTLSETMKLAQKLPPPEALAVRRKNQMRYLEVDAPRWSAFARHFVDPDAAMAQDSGAAEGSGEVLPLFPERPAADMHD